MLVELNLARLTDKEEAQKYLKEAFGFPDYYGMNLDALHDCLTDISGKVRLLSWETAELRLGSYGQKAKRVIASAALQNTDLDLTI